MGSPVSYWPLIALATVATVARSCSDEEEPDEDEVDEARVERCREAFGQCLADESIPEALCFEAYSTCVRTKAPMIFPGGGVVK